MSPSRWALSALILLHVAALTVGLIPSPEDLNTVGPVRYPTDLGWISARVTPVFDRLALVVSQLEPHVFASTRPLAPMSRLYLKNGLAQQFRMFSNPVRGDEYVRMIYVIASRTGESRGHAREIVLPMDPDDQTRWTLKYRDKALLNSIAAFAMDLGDSSTDAPYLDPTTRERFRATALSPAVRYFRSRFEAEHLQPDERVVRTELWIGEAPTPALNAPVVVDAVPMRRAILETYRMPNARRPVPKYLPLGTEQREADIVWTLARIE